MVVEVNDAAEKFLQELAFKKELAETLHINEKIQIQVIIGLGITAFVLLILTAFVWLIYRKSISEFNDIKQSIKLFTEPPFTPKK